MWESLPALKAELELFEQALLNEFSVKHNSRSYLNTVCREVIQSGGKRLRPAMVIASAMSGEYDRAKAFPAAVSIELLHTATLVHDDIIDDAPLRRGKPTVYAQEGPPTAVFTGDYLYVKSILALASSDLPIQYLQQLGMAIEAVCVGEVDQYQNRGAINGFKTYLSRISRKTGVLFAASCAAGAKTGGLSDEHIKRLARFGGYYGIAFQIKDDLMDMLEKPDSIGKPVGSDLKEGIITLPVLLAIAKDPQSRMLVEDFLQDFDRSRQSKRKIIRIIKRVMETGAAGDTQDLLKRYLAKAGKMLERLPESPGKEMLAQILRLSFG